MSRNTKGASLLDHDAFAWHTGGPLGDAEIYFRKSGGRESEAFGVSGRDSVMQDFHKTGAASFLDGGGMIDPNVRTVINPNDKSAPRATAANICTARWSITSPPTGCGIEREPAA